MGLTPGAREFAEWLARQGIPTALVTRNTRATIDHLHATLWKGLPPFSPAISRDDNYEPKQHPAALEAILKTWEIADPAEVVMVGDSPANDVVFGKKAGVLTALVDSGRRFVEGGSDEGASMVVENIADLAAGFHERFELPKAGPLQKYDVPSPSSDAGRRRLLGTWPASRPAPTSLFPTPRGTRRSSGRPTAGPPTLFLTCGTAAT